MILTRVKVNIFKLHNFLYNIIVMKKLTVLLLLILLTAALELSAAELKFELSVDKTTLAIGEGTQLSLTFTGDRGVPQPNPPQIDDFSVNYMGSSTQMSIINGSMSSSVSYNYSLVPMKKGEFKIGPFSVQHDGKTYSSNTITINVVDGQGGASQQQPKTQSQQKTKAAGDMKDRLFITLKPSKTAVYVNEIFTVKVKLHVRDIAVREVGFPQVADGGFSLSNFEKPVQTTENINGLTYQTVEFTTTAFAATAGGSMKLGAATLDCNIMIRENRRMSPGGMFNDDFFNNVFASLRPEPVKLKSEAVTVKVLPLPEEGKPKGFRGALGKFEMSASVTPENVKTGDPVTLKMTFSGKGNFNTITKPEPEENANLKYYEPQIKQDPNSKNFDTAVIPLTNTVTQIPEVVFSYFDPDEKSYKTIKRGPFPIKVTGAATATAAKIVEQSKIQGTTPVEKEVFAKDVVFIKEHPGNLVKRGDMEKMLYRNPIFLSLSMLPLLIYIFALIHAKRSKRLRNDVQYVRRLRAPKQAREGIKAVRVYLKNSKEEEFYNTVHKTVYEYLGNKLHLPPGEAADEKIYALLEQKGVETQLLKEILNACELARYAKGGTVGSSSEMERIFKHLEDFIDKTERTL
ncbi:BatD family protein [Candidatus Magnetomonas plexicatena]|uniref:BatD family protein n=1 Tax=Candidatus Magnetomonas plexicatena TaxID=2552947 RepID=UPI001C76454C|nr:protein BatD [Nitrospirales bacterium LBB_01]